MTTDTPATTTGQPPARRRMEPTRKIALAAGVAYLVTFAASIPQLKLFGQVIADPAGYISNPGSNAALQWGSVLEFLTAASGVATAVLLYPVTRRADGTTVIDGPVIDQSALHGLLRKVSDLGLPLVSLTPTPDVRTSLAAELPRPVDDDL